MIEKLDCSGCSVTSIPHIEGLEELTCYNCDLLTSIPQIEGLQLLYCTDCPLIKSIPQIKGLKFLTCSNCPLLISISNIKFSNKNYYYNCHWLSINEEFHDNLEQLIECQEISKRVIKRKHFCKFIKSKSFNEWFYSPN